MALLPACHVWFSETVIIVSAMRNTDEEEEREEREILKSTTTVMVNQNLFWEQSSEQIECVTVVN